MNERRLHYPPGVYVKLQASLPMRMTSVRDYI